MVLGLLPQIVLYDTEYTTWPGAQERRWSGKGEHREIVQIGAVRVDTTTFAEIDTFNVLVKPRINPRLSNFFTSLTGISQVTVHASGIDFVAAWKQFNDWRNGDYAYSYGNDEDVIKENCHLTSIPYNTEGQFHNICMVFEKYGIQTDQYHSSTIVTAFGVKPREGAHNALNDARSILDGLILLAKQHISMAN